MVHEIENFYGVYLLYCLNPKYKGRTYIGFTVNPNRRIKQHNRGKQAGGARRTDGKGPWEMVLIVHGFPNMISALRFEWAWTKPEMSRRLRHLPKKKKNDKKFNRMVEVLGHMINMGPWDRLPLTIRWLKQEYQRDLGVILDPPNHMSVQYGPVKTIKTKSIEDVSEFNEDLICCLCCDTISKPSENSITCFNCKTPFHAVCLAELFLKSSTNENQLLPVEGSCPSCSLVVLWGDLIRYKRGCYQNDDDADDMDAFTDWSKEIET